MAHHRRRYAAAGGRRSHGRRNGCWAPLTIVPHRSGRPGDTGPRSLARFADPPSSTAVSTLNREIREGCEVLQSDVQSDLELASLLATVDEPGALRVVLDRMESRLRSFDRDLRSTLARAAVEREAEAVVAAAEREDVRRTTVGFAAPLVATVAGIIVAAVVVLIPGPPTDDSGQAIAGATATEAAPEDAGLPSLKGALEMRSPLILAWGLRAGYAQDPGPTMATSTTPRSDRILERLAGAVDVYSRELRAVASDLQGVVKSVAEKVPVENDSDWILDVDDLLPRVGSDGDDAESGEEDSVSGSDSPPADDGDEHAGEAGHHENLEDGPFSDRSEGSEDAEQADAEEDTADESDGGGDGDGEGWTLTGLF
jgi:hypothetical protein